VSNPPYLEIGALPSPSALDLTCMPDPCYVGLGALSSLKHLGSSVHVRPTLYWV